MKPAQIALLCLACALGAAGEYAVERIIAPRWAFHAARDERTGEVALFRMDTRSGQMAMKSMSATYTSPWVPIVEGEWNRRAPAQVPPVP